MIRQPTPVEVLDAQLDSEGQLWYLVRNMNTDESGYLEAYKVEEISREEAEAAVMASESTPLPPVPSENEPENRPETEETAPPEEEPEITVPDTPQELTDGDVYHYGRNTGRQVGLRKAPSKSGDRIYNMEAGTILWVISKDGDWCHVRTDRRPC